MRVLASVLMRAVVASACGDNDRGVTAADEGGALTVPPVDTSVHAVDLHDVVFDTFDGGSVPLAEASPGTIRRLLDAIVPLDDPEYDGERLPVRTALVVLGGRRLRGSDARGDVSVVIAGARARP